MSFVFQGKVLPVQKMCICNTYVSLQYYQSNYEHLRFYNSRGRKSGVEPKDFSVFNKPK